MFGYLFHDIHCGNIYWASFFFFVMYGMEYLKKRRLLFWIMIISMIINLFFLSWFILRMLLYKTRVILSYDLLFHYDGISYGVLSTCQPPSTWFIIIWSKLLFRFLFLFDSYIVMWMLICEPLISIGQWPTQLLQRYILKIVRRKRTGLMGLYFSQRRGAGTHIVSILLDCTWGGVLEPISQWGSGAITIEH
jgi:hypothetical protein